MDPIVKLVVIKLGTEMLLRRGRLSRKVFNDTARQVMQVQKLGVKVVIVTSGGIKAGMEMMKLKKENVPEKLKPLLAGVGNPRLFTLWGDAFKPGVVSQILVTHANVTHDRWKAGLRARIQMAFSHGIIPVINANDVVFPEEINSMRQKISENDKLARMVADLVGADGILFLTKCGGVHEDDRRVAPGARSYREIDISTASRITRSASTKSTNGSGGISAKLKSAIECAKKGRHTVIAGRGKNVIPSFVGGVDVGTRFGTSVSFW